MLHIRNAKNRGAFTLTELAIVMGVIGTIIGAIWLAASNTNEARKENDAVNEVQQVIMNMDTLMMGQTLSQGGGANITSAMLAAAVIPSNYGSSGNPSPCTAANGCTADNPWQTTDFLMYQMGASPSRNFYIKIIGIPAQQGCVALISSIMTCQAGQAGCPIYADAASDGTDGATAGGALAVYASSTPLAPTPTNITKLCALNSYTAGGANFVLFEYKL